MSSEKKVTIIGLRGLPEIREGDELGRLIAEAALKQGLRIEDGDIVVITHKIVSKAEGRLIPLSEITPSDFAYRIASVHGKDPRYVEAVLREAKRIVRMKGPHLIVENRLGHICANAGLDRSNVDPQMAVMLPVDPDRSAARIREALEEACGAKVGVIITDTWGRPFRNGQVNVAIGVSGLKPLKSYIGKRDRFGNKLRSTVIAVADELASAAELVMGKVDGVPVALIKGYRYAYSPGRGDARMLIREPGKDLFA
ncbi:MAG: coenzyme F420-0:L-glutamate ligase [Candidatus Bathyarchaeia archaeon]|nr:coenzyme F420-0:L-glutamate ligase [Candidatus Bathyarchaeota archaeon]